MYPLRGRNREIPAKHCLLLGEPHIFKVRAFKFMDQTKLVFCFPLWVFGEWREFINPLVPSKKELLSPFCRVLLALSRKSLDVEPQRGFDEFLRHLLLLLPVIGNPVNSAGSLSPETTGVETYRVAVVLSVSVPLAKVILFSTEACNEKLAGTMRGCLRVVLNVRQDLVQKRPGDFVVLLLFQYLPERFFK